MCLVLSAGIAKGRGKGQGAGSENEGSKKDGADDLGIAHYKHEVPVIIPKGSLGT